VDAASVAILACDIAIEKMERFARIRKIEVSAQEAIKNPRAVLARAG
jgi:fructose-specific phosphotransferase system component IIB